MKSWGRKPRGQRAKLFTTRLPRAALAVRAAAGASAPTCDFSNFTISADLASSSGQIHAGFLLRLDSSDANGYLATLDTSGPQASFAVFEGASLTTPGSLIFSKAISTIPFASAANTFYNLKVTVTGGTFSFDFDHGIATATFTDTSVTATSGQVGILLEPPPPPQGGSAQLDNFTVVPEPGTGSLIVCIVFGYFGLRRLRRHLSRPEVVHGHSRSNSQWCCSVWERSLPAGRHGGHGRGARGAEAANEVMSEAEHRRILEIMDRIAALPLEGPDEPFSGADHDKYLYGS